MLGKLIKERYVLIEKLGTGGEGTVYLARDLRLGRYWAVKCLPVSKREEILQWKHLCHPMLPQMTDVEEEGDTCFIVMDYIVGENMETYKKGHRLKYREILEWGIELCRVLEYLHGQTPPLVYGDLKPSNLILDGRGTLHLIDFGSISVRRADAGTCVGTPAYAAPEQKEGVLEIQSDIYSLGLLLKEWSKDLKKGRGPLRRIIRRCTQQNLQKRYASCEVLRKKLETLERKRQEERRRALLPVLALAVLTAFGTGLSGLGRQEGFLAEQETEKPSRTTFNQQEYFREEEKRLKTRLLLCREEKEKARILERLSWMEMAGKNYKEAERYGRLFLQEFPEEEEAYGILGNLLFLTGREEESEQLLEQMERKIPEADHHNTQIWRERIEAWKREK